MADTHEYTKERKKFGRHAQFEDSQTKAVCEQLPQNEPKSKYLLKNPNRYNGDNIPIMQVNTINTDRIETKDKGMSHDVGGWPRDYDYTDDVQVTRYLKKLSKDQSYKDASKDLTRTSERCIRQNNEIDLFEEYFAAENAEAMADDLFTKTLMIFKDPNQIKRAITKFDWKVDGGEHRLAVAYAQLRFQQEPPNMPKDSYIWNLNDPNKPEFTIQANSPLCALAWHHKIQDCLATGSYNGSVAIYDLRTAKNGILKPQQQSILEKSHHDPVYDVAWLTQSKAGNDFFTTSTDGRVIWWDMRDLSAPTDQLILRDMNKPDGKIYGGTCICYDAEAHPHKFLVGSEQGYPVLCQRRNNKPEVQWRFGEETGKHFGPVYGIARNPKQKKYFLSVADWTAKIWSEELKIPIMQTRYHNSYLTDGCWSSTRPGLFFLTRMDGFLDVWDFYYRQNEVAYSQKISDSVLTSLYVQGSMCAIGDAEGTTHIIGLCPALYDHTLQPKENEVMATIFDREFRREKTLDVAKRLGDKKAPKEKEAENNVSDLEGVIADIETNFFNNVAEDEEEREMIRNRGRAAMEAAQDDGAELDNFDKAIQEVVEVVWNTYDKDGSGSLDKKESFAFVADAVGQLGGGQITEEGFNEAFAAIDDDGSGCLTKGEMARFIQKMM